MTTRAHYLIAIFGFGALFSGAAGCSSNHGAPATADCTALSSGTSWTPNVAQASASNHDATTSVAATSLSASGPIVGLGQPFSAAQEIELDFTVPTALGAGGSITLTGSITSFPPTLAGGAYPALVSLVDPNGKDWVNLPRTGATGDCWNAGLFSCGSQCNANPGCAPVWPSAFLTRTHWEQHQILGPESGEGSALPSVNTFPSCSWGNVGNAADPADPSTPPCAFSNLGSGNFFNGTGELPTGEYRAKYLIVSSTYGSLPSGYNAGLSVQLLEKSHPALAGGAVDLNVVLVGNATVNASRTPKGQQNLDTLFSKVATIFGAAGGGGAGAIKLGTVNAVEWSCQQGGEGYSQLATSDLPAMFTASRPLLPSNEEGKAITIYLVSSIVNDLATLVPGAIIDGFSGAIGGPPLYDTGASGLVLATFDRLDEENAACPAGVAVCDDTEVDSAFWNSEVTVAHEMGHFFGLNHPSEAAGTAHDPIFDTPICTAALAPVPGDTPIISQTSCLYDDTNVYPYATNYGLPGDPQLKTCSQACPNYDPASGTFCADRIECPFNHVMWYTSKNFQEGAGLGDGNLFTADSTSVMDFSPLVR